MNQVATNPGSRLTTTRRSWQTAAVLFGWLVTVACLVGLWIVVSLADPDGRLASAGSIEYVGGSLAILALVTFGGMVVLRGDSSRYGLLMMLGGAVSAVLAFTGHYSIYSYESAVPLTNVAIWVQDIWMAEHMLLGLVLPAFLPDGRVASRRWRIPVRLAVGAWLVLIVLFAFADRPATNFFGDFDGPVPSNPAGLLPIPIVVFDFSWVLLGTTSLVIAGGSLFTRWRHATGQMRQQLKWALLGVALVAFLVLMRLLEALLEQTGIDLTEIVDLLFSLVGVIFAVAVGLAVLRFRLYDVDLVINRTIVYGVLTVVVIATYVGVVVGIGELLPVQESALALVTTGFVAVGFAPLHSAVQGGVNRLMFGQRDDPYGVLAKLARLLTSSGAPQETLQRLAETVAASLKLPGAAIDLEQAGGWERVARYGSVPEEGAVVPLHDRGELVGRLLVAPRSPNESLSEGDMSLLHDVAGPAAAAARSVRLTRALQASRERLVLAREEERRRIRRDLHDGLGPSLAAQTFQLDEVLDRLNSDPKRAAELVESLKTDNQRLVSDVRRLVYELRPPALDELGLAGALEAYIAQLDGSSGLHIEVSTDPDPLPAVPAAVEVAAYHIVREAMNNVTRHAHASRCVATLTAAGSDLVVSVEDDGRGISRNERPGLGLVSMRERTEELGGEFTVRASSGTEVISTLPLRDGRSRKPAEENGDGHD